MSAKTLPLTPELHAYFLRVAVDEPVVLRELREETEAHPRGSMQISPEQGRFFAFLVETLGVRRALEVGVFTGYSSLSVALAMGREGRLVACDLSEEFTRVALRYWQRAGVNEQIDLRLGPAVETLEALLAEGARGSFDFVFIDADKESYDRYYELSLALTRPGGVVAIDNALWDGRVADPSEQSASTVAIRALNEKVFSDSRVSATLIPIGDGLILARRR